VSDDLSRRICKRENQLKAKRAIWDSHWFEVAQYFIPEHDDIYHTLVPGQKKRAQIFDSTGPQSLILLAAALHGMLTNPSTIWMGLSTGNDAVDTDDDVRKWLQDCSYKMIDVLNASNFQQEIHESYIGIGSFGTALMAIEEDEEKIVRFESRPIYQGYIAESSRGIIDTVYREYKWSLRQIIQEFGKDALPKKFRNVKDNLDDEFEIIHAVEPREDGNIGAISPKNMPFSSVWTFKSEEHTLKESGFKMLPYVVPRWMRVPGETYGRSPAMTCLPDVKMINEMTKTTLRGAQKTVDPPLLLPDDGVLMPFLAAPSKLNFYRAGTTDKIIPLQTDARIDFGMQMIESVQKRIQQAFFIDQLQLDVGPQMTATEVQQRTQEKLRLMGPVLARQQFELLRPLIKIVFGILDKRGELPSGMPKVLQKFKLKVEYVSEIAKAQRLNDMDSLQRVFQLSAPVVQADQSVLDNMNGDELFRYVAKLGGIPQQLIRSQNQVKKIRQNRSQIMQQQYQQQQDLQEAEKLHKAGPTLLKAKEGQAA
jgi:hypothetical protein